MPGAATPFGQSTGTVASGSIPTSSVFTGFGGFAVSTAAASVSPQQQSFTFGTTSTTPSSTTNLFMPLPVMSGAATPFGQSIGTVPSGSIPTSSVFTGFGGFAASTAAASVPPPPPPPPPTFFGSSDSSNNNLIITHAQQPVYEAQQMSTTSTIQRPPPPPPPPFFSAHEAATFSFDNASSSSGKESLSSSNTRTNTATPIVRPAPIASSSSMNYAYAATKGRPESKESDVIVKDEKRDDNCRHRILMSEISEISSGSRGGRGGFSSAMELMKRRQERFNVDTRSDESDRSRSKPPMGSMRFTDVCKSIIILRLNR
jgi:hypothetical protein